MAKTHRPKYNTMIQFYSPDIEKTGLLGPEESQHCVRVLRKKEGETIYVTDGCGRRYECRIADADPRRTRLEIISSEPVEKSWNYKITIAVAPTKNADRMAWLVEKCTEIGVDRIVFVKCRNSERKTVNTERLRRNAISAMNQSLKTHLPEITEIMPLSAIVELEGEKYFGFCDVNTERLELAGEYEGERDVVIAIGPEGDFSEEEVEMLKDAGYRAVTFGDERLRTETAAMYGLTAVHVISDREKTNKEKIKEKDE